MIRGAAVLLAVLLVAPGCATKADVSGLETRMLAEMREIRAEQDSLLRRIGAAFDSLAERDRQALSGRGELQRGFDRLGELLGEVLELASQNHMLLNQLRGGAGPAAGAAPAAGGASEELPRRGEGTIEEATTFYEAALQQYRRGAYETARAGFTDFLETYPEHELVPDARYFRAEASAAAGEREQALEEYRRVWELHPDSRRAPTALYQAGMLELERDNPSRAREFFQRVEIGYPNSPEAVLAAEQLRRIRP